MLHTGVGDQGQEENTSVAAEFEYKVLDSQTN